MWCENIGLVTGIAIVLVVIVLLIYFYVGNIHKNVNKEVSVQEPVVPKERFTMPDSGTFWTFKVMYHPLDADEYTKIYDAGWELISCTTENESYFPNCGPEAPRLERTIWHYAFHKKKEVL